MSNAARSDVWRTTLIHTRKNTIIRLADDPEAEEYEKQRISAMNGVV